MGAREFVEHIRQEVIEANVRVYLDALNTPITNISDPHWRSVVEAYDRMDHAQRSAVLALVRQVMVDTVSNVFGIIDGSSVLSGFREEFLLEYGNRKEILSGELQDLLLVGSQSQGR